MNFDPQVLPYLILHGLPVPIMAADPVKGRYDEAGNLYDETVVFERGIPIDFNVPFGERQFRIATKNEDGTTGTLYCTDLILHFSTRFGDFDNWSGENVINIGLSEVDTESMKHILKIIYYVDNSYKQPYNNDTYVRLINACKFLDILGIFLVLTDNVMKTKNLIVACALEVDNNYYCEMLKGMHICEISCALALLSTEMKQAKIFSGDCIQLIMRKIKEDNEPPFAPCSRCGALIHNFPF